MLSAFLNITHWKELLYFTFLLFLFKFCFISGYGYDTSLSYFDLTLLSISGSSILAAGYLVSYFYRKQNKKVKIPLNKVKKCAIILTVFGISLGTLLSFKIQKPEYSLIFLVCSFIVLLYSKKIRKKTIVNNLFKISLKAVVILMVCWFDYPQNLSSSQWDLFFKLQTIILIYVSISFFCNVFREIIIDINNLTKDNANKHSTLPIVLGRDRAKSVALTAAIVVSIILVILMVMFYTNLYVFTIITLFGTLPLLYFIYHLIKASSEADYKYLYKISNIGYLLAILSVPFISFYLKYVIK